MSSQRKILLLIAFIVVVLAVASIIAWHKSSNVVTEMPLTGTGADTAALPAPISATTPAEVVSNTTFDIVSPSTLPASSTVSGEAMPGSSGY